MGTVLVTHGIETVHWSAIGEVSAPDSLILDYAASNGFVIFTDDLDFGMLPRGAQVAWSKRDSG
jgi:predicted nuclease of predicted toxin-antitoxin system